MVCKRFYTGIGSRETPGHVLDRMAELATWLAKQGYILRSGGADGADTAFEEGCDSVGGKKRIYLPWKGFNGRHGGDYLSEIPAAAFGLAEAAHPSWHLLSDGAKKLHARNVLQVLGRGLRKPSVAVICWTRGGQWVGGTRTAIALAHRHKIPVFNLGATSNTPTVQSILAWFAENAPRRDPQPPETP